MKLWLLGWMMNLRPVMSKIGYETNIDNLSGGERTSLPWLIAALNKVINDIISADKN